MLASLTPCLRQSSETGVPASCSFRMPMILFLCETIALHSLVLSMGQSLLQNGLFQRGKVSANGVMANGRAGIGRTRSVGAASKRVDLSGIRSADYIRASGMNKPQSEAEYMPAPDQLPETLNCPLPRRGRPYMPLSALPLFRTSLKTGAGRILVASLLLNSFADNKGRDLIKCPLCPGHHF